MKIPKLKDLQDFIYELPLVAKVTDWSKNNSFPGFFKVPLYDVIIFILNEIKRNTLVQRANSVAFSFFLSLFPALLFIFTLIPYILPHFDFLIIPNLSADQIVWADAEQTIVDFSRTIIKLIDETIQEVKILPESARVDLVQYLGKLATSPRVGQLSFVLLLTIFFSSNGMMTLFMGFQKSHKSTFKDRSPIKKRLVAIALTFMLGFLVMISSFLIVLGRIPINYIMDIVHLDQFSYILVNGLRWVVIIALFYFGISMVYRYGASTFQRFHWFSPGATLATISSIVSILAFTMYVDKFDTYDSLYGGVGTIIVIMLWIQINAFILLIGFELNASIAVNRDLKIMKEED